MFPHPAKARERSGGTSAKQIGVLAPGRFGALPAFNCFFIENIIGKIKLKA
jgi:hypothetical protein